MIDAILVPRGIEARAVRRGLGRHHAAWFVFATRAGIAAASAVDEALARGAKRVLIVGLCGSLDPAFAPGDVLVYDSIQTAAGATIVSDADLTMTIVRAVKQARYGVRGLEVERVVTRADEKAQLAERSGAQAIDMETGAIASRLRAAGIAFAVLRCVSDGAGGDLPDIGGAFGAGGIKPFAVARAMLVAPRRAMRLISGGLRGLRSLRRAIARLC